MRSNTKRFIDEFLRFTVAGSVMGAGLLFSKSTELISEDLIKYLETSTKEQEFKRLLRYMERQKLIETVAENDLISVKVTEKGKKRIVKVDLESIIIPIPKKWDLKWRLVMFDIPKDKQTQRMYFLERLRTLGFYKLQASFWVYPFPCEEQIHVICEAYGLRQYTSIATCEFHSIESKRLLRVFKRTLAN